jgi:small-conductance mechanosensitive channel
VKVGDIEGTVTSLGVLSTQIRTLSRELVTVPNSVVVQREAINYSRFAREGTPIRTTLTLGYDAPWRQVEAILLQAASRTNGVRSKPAPLVLKTALSDFYVEYELIAYIDDPRTRRRILSELHSHVLDLANEHGVQIMSPHYVADPDAPIVLSRERWAPPPAGTGTAGGEEER